MGQRGLGWLKMALSQGDSPCLEEKSFLSDSTHYQSTHPTNILLKRKQIFYLGNDYLNRNLLKNDARVTFATTMYY